MIRSTNKEFCPILLLGRLFSPLGRDYYLTADLFRAAPN